jgi:hypothetical protein
LNSAGAVRSVLVAAMLAGLVGCRPPGYGKEPPPDASPDGSSMMVVDAAIDATVLGCDHGFRIDGYATAASVWLTGTMVNWAGSPPGAVEFMLGADGAWTATYRFEAGTHQYKLIVNGTEWILDPTNPNTADDGMGHTNNVYTCVP